MSYYPATIVEVNEKTATARIDTTGHQIAFAHAAFNAVPETLRHVGAKGMISFPKAPPVFSVGAADAATESPLIAA